MWIASLRLPRIAISIASVAVLASCSESVGDSGSDRTASQEPEWDSQDGNPTHATHSYLAEYAIDHVKTRFPEVEQFRGELIDGANRELHELKVDGAADEALRIEIGGNNWASEHPEILWAHAREHYAASDKGKAYLYVGILLHYVQDMGVPAHAFHVIHQSGPSEWDHFEVFAFQQWSPNFNDVNRQDPKFADPTAYVTWSGEWAAQDFRAMWPNTEYTRTYFPRVRLFASSHHKRFVGARQAGVALVTAWALEAAAANLISPPIAAKP